MILPRALSTLRPAITANNLTATAIFSASNSTPMTSLYPSLNPKNHAALSMAVAMALHFFGYEFARGGNMALFTSSSLGFGADSASYYTLAMTCVSPTSMLLLLGYGRLLDVSGPKKALVTSTGFCAGVLALFALAISMVGNNHVALWNNWTLSRVIVWTSFVFQNSYAHLLYAQMWSFLGSIFVPSEAGKYYSYVAGLSSIASMVAGVSVSRIVTFGLPGLLGAASLSLCGSLIMSTRAYTLAEKNGFDPSLEMQKRSKEKKSKQGNEDNKKLPLVQQMKDGALLFRRVPALAALFFETITFQSLCTVLNTSLVTQLKDAVPDDQWRAAWTGRFYGFTNGLSTLFQFLIMPALSQRIDPKSLWKLMPVIPAICAVFQVLSRFTPSSVFSPPFSALYLVAFSFLAAKTMDYSLRNILAELVYVPLDFESRYVGKEIIAVFANRFGKSGMAVILSGLQFLVGRNIGSGGLLTGMAFFVSLAWWVSCISLSSRLMSQDEAERAVGSRMSVGAGGDDISNKKMKDK
ncbi:hypothetical protein HJC23_002895 [Cyclotella cryptica]|uniref:ADP,ATP carrier protein n=1 Tax=Cyclotella cryptica TaxID=29204 RepID=A0ABD3PIP5_9STRA|eukprot:CCRYP_014126-RA/>CCRYP_014126-RA protein AED:0.27 eAED:0.27 QI:4877/1/1/1/0.25/0.2/5/294/522